MFSAESYEADGSDGSPGCDEYGANVCTSSSFHGTARCNNTDDWASTSTNSTEAGENSHLFFSSFRDTIFFLFRKRLRF